MKIFLLVFAGFLFISNFAFGYTQKDAYQEYLALIEKSQKEYDFYVSTENMFAVLARQFITENYVAYVYKVFDFAIMKCEDLPKGWKFKDVPTYPIIVFKKRIK